MIQATQLRKSFGTLEVLKGIDFSMEQAEVVAIMGASGSGSLLIDGTDVLALKGNALSAFRNQRIGFVFQAHHLLPEFTARENVMMPALIGGTGISQARKKADELLEAVGLAKRATHKPSELSGGEQQRVAIARALINPPAILFADEPTGNLDTRTKDEIHQLLLDIRRDRGQSVVIVTHDNDLARLCDRSCFLQDGAWK